jgi:hypothetical protein
MTNPRDGHFEAVGFAALEVEELEQFILLAKEKAGSVAGSIANAAGASPSSDAGRNALALIAAFPDKLDELLNACEEAKAELTRYGGGF